MASFTITARYPINRGELHISKGAEYTIHINMYGITPQNLFSTPRCREMLAQQFKVNGIDVPKTDLSIYSRGVWDVKML